MKEIPSRKILKELLSYDKETGRLFWKKRSIKWFVNCKNPKRHQQRWNTCFEGKSADTYINGPGYRCLSIFDTIHAAHRIIWVLMKDEVPNFIDHINGIKTDNRILNLRNVPSELNARNQKISKYTKHGCAGVRPTESGKWFAGATIKNKPVKIGYFEDKESAIKARKEFNLMNGFSDRHGVGK